MISYTDFSPAQVITLVLLGMYTLALIALWPLVWMLYRMGIIIRPKETEALAAVDTNKLSRVVISQKSDEEHIISRPSDSTFGEACLKQWPFEHVDEDAN